MKILLTGGSGFIGTNYIDRLREQGATICNIDKAEPKKQSHREYWQQADILDGTSVQQIFSAFQPELVVHLAAETSTDSDQLEFYAANIAGTANVLEAISNTPAVQRVVMTSTQFVMRPGRLPQHDQDYDPHTVYGESKVQTEKLTREAGLDCTWTIIRPTNVWGPWHPRYPEEFWRVMQQGRYVHPGREPVIRCYGYVGSVIYQIEKILEAEPSMVHEQVFYVGDAPVELYQWVDGFARGLTGRPVRVVPRALVRTLALCGDVIKAVGGRFPIFTSRYRSMTQDYPTPMQPTLDAFGTPPYTLEQGIEQTVRWLREHHPDF